MPSLTFEVESAEAVPFAAIPTVAFRVRVSKPPTGPPVKNIALRSQILIEASRRHYQASERNGLRDLFGEPERWSQTLRSLLWTHASITIPPFEDSIAVDLPVPCTFDFNIGAAKYFHAVQDDDVPLCFQFSGTVFYVGANNAVQIDQIGWDQEASFRLPAKVWHEMMDHYYPNSTWLRLRRDAFERLYEYKTLRGIPTWEEAIESLLLPEKEAVS
jgi:hypothetical protein